MARYSDGIRSVVQLTLKLSKIFRSAVKQSMRQRSALVSLSSNVPSDAENKISYSSWLRRVVVK